MTEKDLPAEHIPEIPSQQQTEKPARPISGFWRRPIAFLLDNFLLGFIGCLLGLAFYKTFIRLGWQGRLVGLAVFVVYFALFQSRLGGGQSPGKKVLNIKVVGRDGRALSLARAILRATVLGLPLFLNKLPLPPRLAPPAVVYAQGVIIFGGTIGLIYFYIFNYKSRQSLHDLICGTYVVKAKAVGPLSVAPTARIHYAVFAVLIAAVLLVPNYLLSNSRFKKTLKDLEPVHLRIQALEEVTAAETFVGWLLDKQYVRANVFLRGKPPSFEAEAEKVANVVLETYPGARKLDWVLVSVSYGFDIGLAHWYQTYFIRKSTEEWRRGGTMGVMAGRIDSTVSFWGLINFRVPFSS